jgi:hypothetical protein
MMEHKKCKVSDGELTLEYDFFFKKIIPKIIIEKGIPLHIEKLNPKFHLEGFMVERWNKKLRRVKVFGIHPNADGDTGELCLKKEEEKVIVNDVFALAEVLLNRLEVYYYDESHFRLNKINYKTKPVDAYKTIDVNFKKGEIYGTTPPFRRLYPTRDRSSIEET